jgi:hypothetical protein
MNSLLSSLPQHRPSGPPPSQPNLNPRRAPTRQRYVAMPCKFQKATRLRFLDGAGEYDAPGNTHTHRLRVAGGDF